MINTNNNQDGDNSLEKLKVFVAQWKGYFDCANEVMAENELLLQRVAELEKKNAELEAKNAELEEKLEMATTGDEWSSRVTYESVVEQIAACEDAKERDEARKLIEPLLKRAMVTRFRRDIKRRVKELNEEDGYSDEQIARALNNCVGPDKVISSKRRWAGAYWWLRWACNYPVDVRRFCDKIQQLPITSPEGLECSYESIRKICTLSFMDYNACKMDDVKVSRNDQDEFNVCREVALKLAEELGKT